MLILHYRIPRRKHNNDSHDHDIRPTLNRLLEEGRCVLQRLPVFKTSPLYLWRQAIPQISEDPSFDMSVERMQFLVQLFDGDKCKVRELVNKWIDEEKRRYDASE